MAGSILQIIASIIAYCSAQGISNLLGRWAAYFTIAWEKSSNDAMKKSFSETVDAFKLNLPKESEDWQAWREKTRLGRSKDGSSPQSGVPN